MEMTKVMQEETIMVYHVTNDDGTVSAFSNDSSVQFTHGNRTFNKDGFVNESHMEFSICKQ